MDYDKMGPFLKDLRLSKNISQYALAEQMHVDHSKINRLENNKRRPNFDDLVYYSRIFNISLDELVACERKNKQNEKKLQTIFFEYLHKENSKFKKAQFIVTLLTIFSIICFIGITILYFFQNYDTMKIYTFSGSSSSYEIADGLLVLSKEKIYFQIGSITPEVENIKIFTEINNKRQLVYDGEYKNILKDTYGYESFISYKNFIHGKQYFFVIINDEEIPLQFNEEISNNNLMYKKEKKIGSKLEIEQSLIPKKINDTFQCDENNNCILIENNEVLMYNLGFFFVNTNEENYSYELSSEILSYSNFQKEINFEMVNNKVNCIKGNCENAKKIYENFYKNYVEKYIKE